MVASIAIAYSSVMHMHLAPSEEAGMKIVLAIRDSHLYDPPAAGRILECLQAFQDESGDFGGSLLRAFYDKGTDQKPQLIEFAPEAPLSAVRSMQRSMGKAAAKEKFYPTTDSGYRLKVDSLVGDTEALQLAVLLAAESDTDSGYMLVDHIDGTFRYSLAESSTDTQL
jgi:hypothetical protein